MMKQTIQAVLKEAAIALRVVSDSPQLDAEILLAEIIKKPRSYLHAYPEYLLTEQQLQDWHAHLQRRLAKEPLAYIIGKQAFWDLDLLVTSAVLIPRPETELIIEIILNLPLAEKKLEVVDLGTGSGAIALTLAKHRPNWQLYAIDQSLAALEVAQKNAAHLALKNVVFIQSHWCDQLPKKLFDIIVSNPPYLASGDPHLLNLTYEPSSALVANENGLAAFQFIIPQARKYLKKNGLLILEHGYEQAASVRDLLLQQGFENIELFFDLQGHPRTTMAKNPDIT